MKIHTSSEINPIIRINASLPFFSLHLLVYMCRFNRIKWEPSCPLSSFRAFLFNSPLSHSAIDIFETFPLPQRPRLPPLPHPRQYTSISSLSWASAVSSIAPHREIIILTHTGMHKNGSEQLYAGRYVFSKPIKVHLLLTGPWHAWNKGCPHSMQLIKQSADHIGRIKAMWQHPLHPPMTLEEQSSVFTEHAGHVFVQKPQSPVWDAAPSLPTMSLRNSR